MITAPDSFRSWLTLQITQTLTLKSGQPSFLVWCDPQRAWRDILLMLADESNLAILTDDIHELILREHFFKLPRVPCVIWLPVSQEDITYFRVFALQAADIKEWTLSEALSAYGISIASDQLSELKPHLAAYIKEWFDRPKSAWKELTPGNARSALVDDELFLEVLASHEIKFEDLLIGDRFSIFVRRAKEDFGLPVPTFSDAESWRLQAMATMLCTDAAAKYPGALPLENNRIIPPGIHREHALKLLARWQKQIDLLDFFEEIANMADGLTTLSTWAGNISSIPLPLSSPAAEKVFFLTEVERLAALNTPEDIAKYLDTNSITYQRHAESFWGQRAKEKICWSSLVELATIASLLYQQERIETRWRSPSDAVAWFTTIGWQVDRAGEALFQEDTTISKELAVVRTRLRKAYLRHLDRINSTFSDLLYHSGLESLALLFPGDILKENLKNATSNKDAVAILILDACRYDLGCRLAAMLNQGEPIRRAEVSPARAPIPSITALGMPLCLPGISDKLRVDLPEKEGAYWRVTAEGFSGDLTKAEQRREWLKRTYKLRDSNFLWIDRVLDTDAIHTINSKLLGKLIFVFGDEFDADGHDGQLRSTGSEEHLKRYASAIRILRSGGYSTIVVLTDHGFFHWLPEQDEIENKPSGNIRWTSRRAIAGDNLQHPSALPLIVTASDIECRVPRSVNAFKTYGGLGYFHGGATLEELIIPVVTVRWPKKAKKIGVVLKPISQIVSLTQRVEVAPAATQMDLSGNIDETLLSRQIMVKVTILANGKLIFKSKASITIEPGGEVQTIELMKVDGVEANVGTSLDIRVIDADDEQLLDHNTAILKVELDEWF